MESDKTIITKYFAKYRKDIDPIEGIYLVKHDFTYSLGDLMSLSTTTYSLRYIYRIEDNYYKHLYVSTALDDGNEYDFFIIKWAENDYQMSLPPRLRDFDRFCYKEPNYDMLTNQKSLQISNNHFVTIWQDKHNDRKSFKQSIFTYDKIFPL
ncbi:MAG: hypothetical protein K2H63_10095 [Paramuribaculum sp.]|nr:hypothetical protein [Paramuribaculum sp.]